MIRIVVASKNPVKIDAVKDGLSLFIPEGFELIYASGERGVTEFVGNAALARCDQMANSILDKIDQDPGAQTWTTDNDLPFIRWVSRQRMWKKIM